MDDATMRHDFDDTIVLFYCYLLQLLCKELLHLHFYLRVVMWNIYAGLVTD